MKCGIGDKRMIDASVSVWDKSELLETVEIRTGLAPNKGEIYDINEQFAIC